MFTGIICHTGTVDHIKTTPDGSRLTIRVTDMPAHTTVGSSVCVSGTCLTVVERTDDTLAFDVMPQTLRLTTLGSWSVGTRVNVEPSLTVGQELGGHFLYGHVDDTATITEIRPEGDATIVTIQPPAALMTYLAPQGSVALDGVSLTVAALREETFDVSLIEHTLKETTLSDRAAGDQVNLEVDMMMKYLERIVQLKKA